MARRRQLDVAGRPRAGRPLIRWLGIALALSCIVTSSLGQATDPVSAARQLASEERWQEIVQLAEGVSPRPADLDFFYGMALAKLGRWDDARQAFLAGSRLQPHDKRFLIELAGVEFKQKRLAQAASWLRRALQLDPHDAYANDFSGTVYFLQGNLEAALKYWNRVGKPQVAGVRAEPQLRINPVLLDRTFAFSPASTLYLRDLLTSRARIRGLDIFPTYRFDLAARDDGGFDVVLRARERNGWGKNKWEGLFRFFRGIFQQTVYPEYFNINGSATNFVSLVRWDAEKRRLMASVSGPVKQDPRWRYRAGMDLRNENWDLRRSFTGAVPLLGSLNLRRESANASITSFAGGRWSWSSGVELSHRDFRSVLPGSALTPELLAQGYQLKHLAEVNYELLRAPEHRFMSNAAVSSQVARIWSQPGHAFAKLQASIAGDWFPQSSGDDYEMQGKLGGGKSFGQVPFDELFMLGLERDNDLWLRAHPGTHDGRKGSAPLGRDYLLVNWELDKRVFQKGGLSVKLGPFLDNGRINDRSPGLGSKKWLWDTGLQAKVQALGFGVVFVYGKDLRSGNNAFYLTQPGGIPSAKPRP